LNQTAVQYMRYSHSTVA